MTNDTEQNQKPIDEQSGVLIEGHIKIFDPESEEVYVDKRNAIPVSYTHLTLPTKA